MAINVEQLIAGLKEYRETLKRQSDAITAASESLNLRFQHLWNEYGGSNAERFQAHSMRTLRDIELCTDTSRTLERFLDERIEELEKQTRLNQF